MLSRFAQMRLEFAEGQLDRVEVRRILRKIRLCSNMTGICSSSLRKNLEIEPMFSQVRVDFWRWIELWSLRSAVDYAATSLGMRIRL